jgi:excisionase family DNA binding protein
MSNDKYITVAELAKYLKMTEKFVRKYFIARNKVQYIKFDRKYLIDRASFEAWESAKLKRVHKR